MNAGASVRTAGSFVRFVVQKLFGRTAQILMLASTLAFAGVSSAGAATALVFDPGTGQVFSAHNADRRWYPASLTKLMTAYVTFGVLRDKRIAIDTPLHMTELANHQEPTKLWLWTGTRLKLSTVLGAMIVKSANDAAVMLAEGVGGSLAPFTNYGGCAVKTQGNSWDSKGHKAPSPMTMFRARPNGLGAARYDDATHDWSRCRLAAFVQRMNDTAQRLGMKRTNYANPNGLPDPRQMTTARDLALLARAIIRDFPDHAPLFSRKSMRFGGGRLRSYNSLLRTMKGADGMKTGFICASGYNIVASATRNGRRVVAVVLGWPRASQRNAQAVALIDREFAILPSNKAPHGHYLDTLPVSGNTSLAPPDIRDMLHSRSCRRIIRPRIRIRFTSTATVRKKMRAKRLASERRKTVAEKPRDVKKVALKAATRRKTVPAKKRVKRAKKPKPPVPTAFNIYNGGNN
jgi:D-alanyl-D-alanine carboxypeptidase